MNVDTADCYKYGSLRRVYRQTSKIESISLSLIVHVPLFYTSIPTSSEQPPTLPPGSKPRSAASHDS